MIEYHQYDIQVCIDFDTQKRSYKWILDLNDSHAQRIVNEYSANLSRVGLDESEWLRKS